MDEYLITGHYDKTKPSGATDYDSGTHFTIARFSKETWGYDTIEGQYTTYKGAEDAISALGGDPQPSWIGRWNATH